MAFADTFESNLMSASVAQKHVACALAGLLCHGWYQPLPSPLNLVDSTWLSLSFEIDLKYGSSNLA